MIATSLDRNYGLEVQLRWASRFASMRGQALLILCPAPRPSGQREAEEVSLAEEARGDEKAIISELQDVIRTMPDLRIEGPDESAASDEASAPAAETLVRLKLLYYSEDPVQALVAEIRASKIELLVATREELEPDSLDAHARRRMFRLAPCEIAFVRPGGHEDSPNSNFLVPVGHGPHTLMALRLARDLAAESSGSMTALRVNQDIGADAGLVAEHVLDSLLARAFDEEPQGLALQVAVDNNVQRGIVQACEDGEFDVVIVGASKLGALGQRLLGTVGGKLIRAMPKETVIITRAANSLTSQVGRAGESALQRLVPQMEREDRISLVERVQPTSQIDFDYLALMSLSSVIAAIGLVQSSAAVVIGAMLVAPLMTPILGLAIALVQGNPIFSRMTVKSIFMGFMLALGASTLVGVASQLGQFDEPTQEMLARGGPGLLDLFVAFASGVAAAYASSRPNLLAAIPGVAIAAALVPPIATAGLALSIGEYKLAMGATLLFVINTFAIVLAAQVSLWAVGLRNIKKQSRQTSLIGAAVIAGVLALAIYLSIAPPSQDVDELLPEPRDLVQAIESKLREAWKEAGRIDSQLFTLKRIDVSHDARGYEVIVRVTGPGFVPKKLSDEVRLLARDQLDEPVQVRVVTQYPVREAAGQ